MRLSRLWVKLLVAATVAAPLPAVGAGMGSQADRLTDPSATATWNISDLRELDDDAGVRDRHGLSVDEIKGMDVVNVAGQRIGVIDDVLADGSGEIVAVTVDVGGFLGVGGMEIIVGIDRLELRLDQFATAMNSRELKQQPQWND